MAAAARHNMENFRAVTWEHVQDETGHDWTMLQLIELIISGFHALLEELPQDIAQYWRFRDKLNVVRLDLPDC